MIAREEEGFDVECLGAFVSYSLILSVSSWLGSVESVDPVNSGTVGKVYKDGVGCSVL